MDGGSATPVRSASRSSTTSRASARGATAARTARSSRCSARGRRALRARRPLPAQGRPALAGHRLRRVASPARCTTGASASRPARPPRPTKARVERFAVRVVDGVVELAAVTETRIHLLLLRRRLRRRDRDARATHHRRARRPRPSRQPRQALHQGLDAAPHREPRRARPAARAIRRCGATARSPRARVSWDAALDHVADRFARCIARARARLRRVLRLRPAPHRGLLRLQQARQGPHRHRPTSTPTRACACRGGRPATSRRSARTRRRACYEDIDHAECLFIAGSNTACAHPVLFRRIEAARAREPGAEGRSSSIRAAPTTARFADLHLAIQPGTDVALFHGMLHLMLWESRIDRDYIAAHTRGFRRAARGGARVDAAGGGGDCAA